MEGIFNRKFFLGVIIFIAAFLRFWQLSLNPPALTWDEAAWGYNAYSLGLTAKDEFGRFLPLDYLESFGDFKPPVYAYLTVLPVKLFGLNEFATRFPSAFFGTLTVLMTYFLVRELFGYTSYQRSFVTRRPTVRGVPPNRRATLEEGLCPSHFSLLTSFLLAISPWHIMLSRAAFEANVATFFLVAGVTFFLRGLRRESWLLLASAISFTLSLNTFNTARIVAPLLVFGLVIGFREKVWEKKKWLIRGAALGLIILLPSVSFFLSPQVRLRYREVNIFSDAGIVATANQEIENDNWAWWSSLIHNRRWGYARAYLSHYFHHFNPAFLFIKGDGNPKFSTQDVGELYLWELPFLVGGVLFLLRKKPGYWWLILFWLLVGVAPAATARETPHALRIETTLPTWQILTAFGMVEFWRLAKKQKSLVKNLLPITLYSLLITNFVYFQHGYWRHYPAEFSGEWQYGYQETIQYIKEVENDYDQVWFTNVLGRPYVYFLYYLKKDPTDFWQEAQVERDPHGFVQVTSFGKYHFFRDGESLKPEGEALILNLPERIPEDEIIIKTFYLLNGEEILKAYTNLPDEKSD